MYIFSAAVGSKRCKRSLDSLWLTRYAALRTLQAPWPATLASTRSRSLTWCRSSGRARCAHGPGAVVALLSLAACGVDLCVCVYWRGGDGAARRCHAATTADCSRPQSSRPSQSFRFRRRRKPLTDIVRLVHTLCRLSSSTRACACLPSPAGSRSTWASACRLRRTSRRSTRTTPAWSAAPCWACSSP